MSRLILTQVLLTALISFGAGYVLAPHASDAETINHYIVAKPTKLNSVLNQLTLAAEYDPDAFDMDNLKETGVFKYVCGQDMAKGYSGSQAKRIQALCIEASKLGAK